MHLAQGFIKLSFDLFIVLIVDKIGDVVVVLIRL
jgi:hypothetical protein